MLFNEYQANLRSREILAVCCGYTTDYLLAIIKEYCCFKRMWFSERAFSLVTRAHLIAIVVDMVYTTRISDDAGTWFWIVPNGRYLVDLND